MPMVRGFTFSLLLNLTQNQKNKSGRGKRKLKEQSLESPAKRRYSYLAAGGCQASDIDHSETNLKDSKTLALET
jgi:hypothetical protein